MPFQPINFASVPTESGSSLGSFINGLINAYGAVSQARGQRSQTQGQDISNQMNQLKVQQEPQQFQADLASKKIADAFNQANTSRLNTMTPLDAQQAQAQLRSGPALLKLKQDQFDLDNALKRQQIIASQMNTDPRKKIAFMQQVMQAFGNGNQPGNSNSPMSPMDPSNQNQGMNGSMNNGQGYAPNMPNNGSNPSIPSDLSQIMMRKTFGFPEQTPQEKNAQDLNLYENKKKYDMGQQNDLGNLTRGAKTKIQDQNRAIAQLLPMVGDLYNFDEPSALGQFGNDSAAYDAKVGASVDKYVGALGLNPSDKSADLAKSVLRRAKTESQSGYHDRLGTLNNELIRQRMINDPNALTKGGKTRLYNNGSFYWVPNEKVKAALEME